MHLPVQSRRTEKSRKLRAQYPSIQRTEARLVGYAEDIMLGIACRSHDMPDPGCLGERIVIMMDGPSRRKTVRVELAERIVARSRVGRSSELDSGASPPLPTSCHLKAAMLQRHRAKSGSIAPERAQGGREAAEAQIARGGHATIHKPCWLSLLSDTPAASVLDD
jgi:hypothetical protein